MAKNGHGDGARWEEAPWSALVLVCGKCLRRADLPGAGRSELKAALKARTGRKRVRVVQTGCLGVCPKGGVAVASAAGLARGEVLVIGEASTADCTVALLLDADRLRAGLVPA